MPEIEVEPKHSPALELLELIWTTTGAKRPTNWLQLNGCMESALILAIKCGMAFAADDFKTIAKPRETFRRYSGYGGYKWLGADGGEPFYSHACSDHGGNTSACLAYEEFRGRAPFILKHEGALSGERLHVGSNFLWNGGAKGIRRVYVTSFNDKASTLTACSYLWDADKKVNNLEFRFAITHEQVRDASRAFVASVTKPKTTEPEREGKSK